MATLRITQRRSVIGTRQAQRATLRTLGLKKIGQSVDREDSDPVRGMLRSIAHLISFEEIVETPPAKKAQAKTQAKSALKTPKTEEKPTGKSTAKAASGTKARTTRTRSSTTRKTAAKATARKPARKTASSTGPKRSGAKKAE